VTLCKQIKSRLSIRQAASLLGIDLPDRDGRKFHSPFRPDNSPSCEVFRDHIVDRSTDERFDVIDVFGMAKGISSAEAIKGLAGILQIVGDTPASPFQQPKPTTEAEAAERGRKRAAWPQFEQPCRGEVRQIAGLRGLSPEGVQLAADRDLLWCVDLAEGRGWIVTDATRRNAQARRMDGKPWERIKAKAWTLPGSEASWPVGLREAAPFPAIALVEGGPDLLAGLHLAWCADAEDRIAVVSILGAGNRIPDQALPAFTGHHVRIFGHADEPGQKAGQRWARQLAGAGVTVTGFTFAGLVQSDGSPVNDLNDFASIDPDRWKAEHERIESAFNFAFHTPDNQPNRKP